MSSITFHSFDHGDARLSGAERAYMRRFASRLALAQMLTITQMDRERLVARIRNAHVFRDPYWEGDFAAWFSTTFDGEVRVEGEWIGCTELALNTMLSCASDPFSVMARLHGSCESHAFVEPEDFEWFARTIEAGREHNLFRPRMGWDKVADLARRASGSAWPIVTSYSVTDSFPGPNEDEWNRRLTALRAEPWKRIAPRNAVGYLTGRSAFDLADELMRERNTVNA